MFKRGFDLNKTLTIIFWTAVFYAVFFNFSALEADRKCKEEGWNDSTLNWHFKAYCLRDSKRGVEKVSLTRIKEYNGR